MENSELEDLDQLVSGAGWLRFQEMVAKEWGTSDGGGASFLSAVTKAANLDDASATAHLRQIIAAQKAVQAVMRSVEQRITVLKKVATPVSFVSRRGTL